MTQQKKRGHQPVEEVPEGEPKRMSFQQYMKALGKHSEIRLERDTGMAHHVLGQIDLGEPIPLSSAKLICKWLSKQFERTIELENVSGMRTVNPGREPSNEPAT